MNTPSLFPVAVFVACYALFVLFPRWRSLASCVGAVLLVILGPLTWREAMLETIHWNVIALFFGTLILAELFMKSRMPAVMAEQLVSRTGTARTAMLTVCALSGVLSMFLENVAVVLLVAPIALSIAERLEVSPVRLLIAIAISSNLQGTATLIGDPPSMILAGHLQLNFNQFFVYLGRPGIFLAVQIGAIASLATLAWLLRKFSSNTVIVCRESVQAWTPSILLIALILGLSLASRVDPGFHWFAGALTMFLAAVGLIWYRLGPHWSRVRDLVRTLDWDTTFFLIGVFVIVGALSNSGWLDVTAQLISARLGGSILTAFVSVIMIAVLVSAFVDNVPFLLAMIPVVQRVAETLNAPLPLLMFGLLIGSCLGGNITPLGASANIVTIGVLKRRGYLVSFPEFMRVGIPFTAAAVTASALFVWWVWAP